MGNIFSQKTIVSTSTQTDEDVQEELITSNTPKVELLDVGTFMVDEIHFKNAGWKICIVNGQIAFKHFDPKLKIWKLQHRIIH